MLLPRTMMITLQPTLIQCDFTVHSYLLWISWKKKGSPYELESSWKFYCSWGSSPCIYKESKLLERGDFPGELPASEDESFRRHLLWVFTLAGLSCLVMTLINLLGHQTRLGWNHFFGLLLMLTPFIEWMDAVCSFIPKSHTVSHSNFLTPVETSFPAVAVCCLVLCLLGIS